MATFDINSDPTSPDMNSYASLDEADKYFAARYDPTADGDGVENWDSFSDVKKTALIVSATRELDTYSYGGLPTSTTQPLQWPRQFILKRDGRTLYGNNEIPDALKQATFELAYWKYTEGDRSFSDIEIDQVQSYSVGPVTYTAKTGAKRYPQKVIDLLTSIGIGAYRSGAGQTGALRIAL